MQLQKYFGFSVQGLGQFQGLFASYSLHRLPVVPNRLWRPQIRTKERVIVSKIIDNIKIIFKWIKIISALIIIAHQAASLYCPEIKGHALFGLKIVTR